MKIHVVLIRTEYASNIGASARAAANMGADSLILIDPLADYSSHESRQMAAGAQNLLSSAVIYRNWDEFYYSEGSGLRVAFSKRAGQRRQSIPWWRDGIEEIKASAERDLYLIFGPEADGLSQEDLKFVNLTCQLPMYGQFSSFNLAQAVLVALTLLRTELSPIESAETEENGRSKPVPLYFPDDLIKNWLTSIGFSIHARKASAYLTMKRLFLLKQPTRHEIQVIEATLQQTLRKLKDNSLGFALKQVADNGGDVVIKDINLT